ncbi:alpha/beta hydrolase family protein [Allosphingosinicella sp.]|uniref:alpha/beta hydrolase family protein n=1 Tax=Allosphingosinicella sp. TaxID=2823234 RepID=UPI0037837841
MAPDPPSPAVQRAPPKLRRAGSRKRRARLSYRAEEVQVPNPRAAGVTLAGTLTLPQGRGPFPAAILITGSGAQDRDETLFGHKPFAVLADYLTRHGIAVLRYDDRGIAHSTGRFAGATSADFATDANAAFAFLAARPDIDRGRLASSATAKAAWSARSRRWPIRRWRIWCCWRGRASPPAICSRRSAGPSPNRRE